MTSKVLPLRRVEGTVSEMSDEALVAACGVGEMAALGALFDRFYDAVRRFLARMAGTDERDLDDLAQATFETALRAAKRYDGRSSVRTWLFGIANNVVRHHVRSEVRRKRLAVAAANEAAKDGAGASGESTPDLVLARERAARLHEAVLELPPKLREVFVLVYLEGVPGAEAARVLGAREGTVWKRLHEARAALRGALDGGQP